MLAYAYPHEGHEHKEKRPTVPARMPRSCPDGPDWNRMRSYLQDRNLDYDTARHNGWYPSLHAGDEAIRVVMPATNSQNIAYWQARSLNDEEPRYQSPPVPRGDSVIQVWPRNTDYCPLTILCEGPMDALAAASHGIRGIALMGNNPTDETITMLRALLDQDDIVTYFTDRDAVPAAIDLVKKLSRVGVYITISDPSPYKDLASMPKRIRADVLQHYLAHSKGARDIPKKGKK